MWLLSVSANLAPARRFAAVMGCERLTSGFSNTRHPAVRCSLGLLQSARSRLTSARAGLSLPATRSLRKQNRSMPRAALFSAELVSSSSLMAAGTSHLVGSGMAALDPLNSSSRTRRLRMAAGHTSQPVRRPYRSSAASTGTRSRSNTWRPAGFVLTVMPKRSASATRLHIWRRCRPAGLSMGVQQRLRSKNRKKNFCCCSPRNGD